MEEKIVSFEKLEKTFNLELIKDINLNIVKSSNSHGGLRVNAGRPAGLLNKETIAREIAKKDFNNRVYRATEQLYNAQFSIATGVQILFRIDKIYDVKTKRYQKQKPVIVDDLDEIADYLDGAYDNMTDESDPSYYYITAHKPDNKAIDSLMDRAYGKPKQDMNITADLNVNKYEKLSDEELKERIRELAD